MAATPRLATTTCLVLMLALSGLPVVAAAGSDRAILPIKAPVRAPDGASALCTTYPWACATGTGAAIGMAELMVIRQVNDRGNRLIIPLTDAEQYGRAEVWALPTAAGGDCEDYVLWKKRELVMAGLSPDRLLIATVLDRDRASHAVLIVRTGAGDLVLDNVTDDILLWDQTGYAFLRVQDPDAPTRWRTSFSGGFLG